MKTLFFLASLFFSSHVFSEGELDLFGQEPAKSETSIQSEFAKELYAKHVDSRVKGLAEARNISEAQAREILVKEFAAERGSVVSLRGEGLSNAIKETFFYSESFSRPIAKDIYLNTNEGIRISVSNAEASRGISTLIIEALATTEMDIEIARELHREQALRLAEATANELKNSGIKEVSINDIDIDTRKSFLSSNVRKTRVDVSFHQAASIEAATAQMEKFISRLPGVEVMDRLNRSSRRGERAAEAAKSGESSRVNVKEAIRRAGRL